MNPLVPTPVDVINIALSLIATVLITAFILAAILYVVAPKWVNEKLSRRKKNAPQRAIPSSSDR